MANVFVGFFIIRKTFILPTLLEHIFSTRCGYVYVCVVSIFFALFQFYLLFFGTFVCCCFFFEKNAFLCWAFAGFPLPPPPLLPAIALNVVHFGLSVGRLVGWMTGCVFVFVHIHVVFYLFIEFNSFTVGCWQTHFQIANNVQFSRFITFCGNKTNWIICALLCYERISVCTYIHHCIHIHECN